MKSSSSRLDDGSVQDRHGFSLVLGGPLYQLWRGARLTDDALEMVQRRITVFILLTWLPLLLLSFIESHALGGVSVPFLRDIDVHVRFLVAMPLLLIAELVVHRRMRPIARTFLERQLIPEDAMAQFNSAFASSMRLRNSVLAECLLIIFVYLFGVLFVWRHYMALDTATWYASGSAGGATLSLAGFWYGYISLPIFQFLLIRWYFRLLIWARFLWKVSRIKLILIPTHPDRVGGLGFLASTMYAFVPLAAAHGALLAGLLANRIFYLGAILVQFKFEIALVVIFVLCLTLGPLLVFSPQLAFAQRLGGREYGTLAERYIRTFHEKWIHGGAPANEPLIGSPDFQSLADLCNSFEVVQSMRMIPATRDGVLQLAITTVAPVVPLALTMMPLDALLKSLFGILF